MESEANNKAVGSIKSHGKKWIRNTHSELSTIYCMLPKKPYTKSQT